MKKVFRFIVNKTCNIINCINKKQDDKEQSVDEAGFFYINAGRYWLCRKWGGEIWFFVLADNIKWCSMRKASKDDIAKAYKSRVSCEMDKELRTTLPYKSKHRIFNQL